MIAHLFGRHPLGVQDDGQSFIALVSGAVGAGYVQRVVDPPLGWQAGGVQRRADIQGDLHVTGLHRRIDLVNRDVRWVRYAKLGAEH